MRISLILALLLIGSYHLAGQSGTIRGSVHEKANGMEMIGVNIYLEGTSFGTGSDFDGNYVIEDITPGVYTLGVSFITFATIKMENVEVKAGEELVLNFQMKEEANELSEAVVQVKAIRNSENAVLAMQKKSATVQDGISSQEIAKSGASNAAESAKAITGTSVVDGKYVYVRGLGDRYSTAQLNGAILVSTDPYINSVPLDLIPSNLLANIVTTKSATPEQPGNFSGGIINLTTKDMPDSLTLSYSNGFSYNPQSSFNNNFMSHEGGKNDWLGYDDGTRALPSILQDEDVSEMLSSPTFYIQARNDGDKADILDEASKSLNPQMEATPKQSFTNYSTALSFGNKYKLGKNYLGLIFGASHRKNYSFYDDGKNQAWDITGAEAEDLFTYYDLKDEKSVENPVVNGMAGLSYQLGRKNEIGILTIYNHDTEKLSRYQSGKIPGIVSGSDKTFETRTLQFKERGLHTTQMNGRHEFSKLNDIELNWTGAYSKSFQNEPDLRFFANENIGDSLYYISVSEYDLPNHYFRYLNDISKEFKADLTIPITEKQKLKVGVRSNSKQRTFEEYRFSYKNYSGLNYEGNQEEYFGEDNTGVLGYDSLYSRYIIGNYIVDDSKISNNYSGDEKIEAAYIMGSFDLFNKMKVSGGVRLEHTLMHVQSEDESLDQGDLDQYDFFPSINMVYGLSEKANLRGSYGKTIARPTMRELAPFVTFDFIGGFLYIGNPELTTTQIDNYDLRWEYFMNPGEVIAISAYYKHFEDPIVKVYNTDAINPEIIFQNTNDAQVYGIEVDVRKNLSVISPSLKNFKIAANFSYIISKVAMDPDEFSLLAEINPETDNFRPFQGQSPFLLNTRLSYYSEKARFGMDVNYNLFGKRLSAIGLNGLPDVYEQPRGLLNISVNKKLGKCFSISAGVSNLLNAEYVTYQTFKTNTYLNESHRLQSSYSLSVTYSIN